jgi:hypothetical protein
VASVSSIPRLVFRAAAILGCFAGCAQICAAQAGSLSLSLNSQAIPGAISLNVILESAPGDQPVSLQWRVNYPGSDIGAFIVSGGPSANFANKTVTCSGNQCVLYGLDDEPIENGVIAVLTFELSGQAPSQVEFSVANAMGASSTANPVSLGAGNSLSVLLQPFTLAPAEAAGLSFAGSAAQAVSFGGWDTTFHLVNSGAGSANARLGLFGNTGAALAVPLVLQNSSPPTSLLAASLDQSLAPGAVLPVDTTPFDPQPTVITSAQLFTAGSVAGFLRYRYGPSDEEAAAALETRNASSYTLAFDETNGTSTGIAVANVTGAPAVIPLLILDNSGALIDSTTIWLPSNGNTVFALGSQFANTANLTGSIRFSTPAGGRISLLGSRSTENGGFAMIPPVTAADTGNGSAAFVSAGGGWITTVHLMNLGSTPAQPHLHFMDATGADLTLPLTYSGNTVNAATLDPLLPPNGTLSIDASGPDGSPVLTGSALVTGNGAVAGFVRFRYQPSGQETSVPLETRAAASYTVLFDNTNGLSTGVAVANLSPTPISVSALMRDENGAQLGAETIAIPSNGSRVFLLPNLFSETVNQAGTIQFTTPSGGQISVLGMRFPASGNFSSIPVVTP